MKKKDPPINPNLPGRYGRMTAAEWDIEVEKFDRPLIADESRVLTPAEQRRWDRVKHGQRRPVAAKNIAVISVGLERRLLRQADRAARRVGISRAQLIARGLHEVLAHGAR